MFSDILKELRNNKGLTQAELAKHLGVTQQAVGRWEKGLTSPDYDTLHQLSDFFQVSVNYLLEGKNPDAVLYDLLFQNDPEMKQKLKSIHVDGTVSDNGIVYKLSPESISLIEDALRVALKSDELKGRICVEIDE